MASFDKAIELDPDNAEARWARVMLWAPAFSSKGGDDSPDRSGFGAELARFEDWWVKCETDTALFVGELQPFFLTYQEESNVALLKQYGRVCAMAMQRWLDRQKSPAFKRPMGKRIRLGIVSGDIRLHSVWMALIKGWFQSFDLERFELVVFSLSDRTDAETSWARSKSDIFVTGPKTISQWVVAMREQNCEILLYPAVGLHATALRLASLRLAPVQINTWGHPETSGLPTLDYYVSAECFEPAGAQDHYSEQLVLLPHLGNRIQPFGLPSSDPGFAAMNIDLERPILVCPGTPFKYQPAHDHVFADIARIVPDAQLVFFRHSGAALANILAGENHQRIRGGRPQRDGPRALCPLAEYPRVPLPPQARRCVARYHWLFRLQHGGTSDRLRLATGYPGRPVLAGASGERNFAAHGFDGVDCPNQG